MKGDYAKSVKIALVYGGVCFLVFWGLSLVGWQLFPSGKNDDEFVRQTHRLGHIVGEKIAGLVLLSITAFFASRAHHPTAKWGIVTGIAAAVTFEIIAGVVYTVQFGATAYREYCGLFYTLFWTLWLGWISAHFAVRRQCWYEKHAA